MSIQYIKGFDGLRGVSIIFVLLTHLGLHDLLPNNDFIKLRLWQLISGFTGVFIFFVISGFLITVLLSEEKQTRGKIDIKRFFFRRFLRLAPLLFCFYIVVAILMFFKTIPVSFIGLLTSIIYLYNFIPYSFYTFELGHTWSLAVEEQFYLLWPFIINKMHLTKVVVTALVVITLCCLFIYIRPYLTYTITYGNHSQSLNRLFKLERWFLPAVGPVMIGSIAALLFRYKSKFMLLLMGKSKTALLIAIVLFITPLWMPLYVFPYLFLFQSAGISIFICLIRFYQNNCVVNFLEFKPLAYVGKLSYGIYVWQGLFLTTGPQEELFIQRFPQNLILTFSCALLSYYTIEAYALSLKNKFYSQANIEDHNLNAEGKKT